MLTQIRKHFNNLDETKQQNESYENQLRGLEQQIRDSFAIQNRLEMTTKAANKRLEETEMSRQMIIGQSQELISEIYNDN